MVDLPVQLSQRQWRRLRPLLAAVVAILDEPEEVSPGELEVAEVLLPAWDAAYGANAVTVAELFDSQAAPALAGFVSAWRDRHAGNDRSARQALGIFCKRLDGRPVAGYLVQSLPVESGVRGWTLSRWSP